MASVRLRFGDPVGRFWFVVTDAMSCPDVVDREGCGAHLCLRPYEYLRYILGCLRGCWLRGRPPTRVGLMRPRKDRFKAASACRKRSCRWHVVWDRRLPADLPRV